MDSDSDATESEVEKGLSLATPERESFIGNTRSSCWLDGMLGYTWCCKIPVDKHGSMTKEMLDRCETCDACTWINGYGCCKKTSDGDFTECPPKGGGASNTCSTFR